MRRIETVQSPEGIKKSGIQLNDMKKLLSVIGRWNKLKNQSHFSLNF